LANEKYSGVYHYNNETFTNIYPQIVPTPVFETIQTMIKNNKYGKRDENMPYLFRNKMICGYCGKPITAESELHITKALSGTIGSGKKRNSTHAINQS
jgi:hypothetical protein